MPLFKGTLARMAHIINQVHVIREMLILYLLEVDALPTGIGSSEDLHAAMLQVKASVVGDKGTHTELL